jgi:MFS family permease
MSTLYPICVAHAHDRMPLDKVLAVSSRLILVSGIGSVIGPLIGSSLKPQFGIDGVFNLMAAAALTLALIAVRRSMVSASPPHLERPFDFRSPQAAALAHDPAGASEDLLQPEHASTHPSVDVADMG